MRLHFSSSSYWICDLFCFKSIYITKSTNLYKLILYIPTSSSSVSSTGKLLVLLRGLMLSRSIKQKVNRVIPTPIQDCFFLTATRVRVCVWVSVKISDGFNPKLHCLSALCICVWFLLLPDGCVGCCAACVYPIVSCVCVSLFCI